MNLRELAVGESAVIKKIGVRGALKQRLVVMGITKGTSVKVIKIAPLGDPIELTVRGYELSIRKSEAECVLVD